MPLQSIIYPAPQGPVIVWTIFMGSHCWEHAPYSYVVLPQP